MPKIGRKVDKFFVVSGYTINTPYEKEVETLKKTLKKFRISTDHIVSYENKGSWEKNCQEKAKIIKQKLKELKKPIVWLDADSELFAYPNLFNDIKEEVAFNSYNLGLNGCVLYFKPTEKVFELIEKWIEKNNKNPKEFFGDQTHLKEVIKENNISYYELPNSYCKIDFFPSDKKIIGQNQASRRFKSLINLKAKTNYMNNEKCLSHQIWPAVEEGIKIDADFFFGLGENNISKINHCVTEKRPWYFIDLGYLTQQVNRYPNPIIHNADKTYFRIVKEQFHSNNFDINKKYDESRLIELKNKGIDVTFKGWKKKEKHNYILLCPSSETVTQYIDGINQDEWIKKTTDRIRQFTSREIRIRKKPHPSNQWWGTDIKNDLTNCHCLVTNMSLSVFDAILNKVPIICTKEEKYINSQNFSKNYIELNKQLHHDNPYYGTSGHKRIQKVIELAKNALTRNILDYGCGKGELAKNIPFPIWEYDPAIENKNNRPRPAELVVCSDVLEHIEPEFLQNVLQDIERCTLKQAYFVIHSGPATKCLSDGRNAHLIQQDQKWWTNKLNCFFKIISIETINQEIHAICLKKNNNSAAIISGGLENIENPLMAEEEIINEWLKYLALNQFTIEEIKNGTAQKEIEKND